MSGAIGVCEKAKKTRMRKKLETHDGERLYFCGTFERFGTKPGWYSPEKTILLSDVKDKYGNIVTEHIWLNYTKGLQKLGELEKGDRICFHARVKEYVKGYVSYREDIDERTVDYKLSHPTKFMKKCGDTIKQGFNLEV